MQGKPTLWSSSLKRSTTSALLMLASASSAHAAPRMDHVIVVIMENHSYNQVRSSSYTASLIANGTVFTNAHAVTHPSEPNYLALWAAATLGVTNDACPAPGSPLMAENLGHACEKAGLTWRAYSENLPSAGSDVCSADGKLYTRKHDPWTNFGNLNHQNERPYSDLAADIAQGKLPNLAFVVPNNCNNSHDCSVSQADGWLSHNAPAMRNALGNKGMLVLTWDENDGSSGNQILTVFAGTPVRRGYQSGQNINHYSVVRTICEALGITPFAGAAGQQSIADVWVQPTPTLSASWGRVKTIYR